MFITATVMAHPKRKAQAEALARELKKYPFMDVTITWDEKNQEWDTGKRAIQSGAGRGQWHLVVQDDALLTPCFYENIEGAIDTLGEKTLISLYTGQAKPLGKRVRAAVEKAGEASWLRLDMLSWGVGILLPSDHIEPLLEFVSAKMYDKTAYDVRVGIFYQRNRIPIYYTNPSLVEHHDELGSLLDHDVDHPRKAHRLATGRVIWNDAVIDI